MRFNRLAFVIAFFLTAVLFAEVAAHAAEANQSTKVTFSAPIEVPGQVLPAGTYLFKLMNPDDLNVVQISSADGTRLYATLQTISASRIDPSDTVVTLAEQSSGAPDMLMKWFYPGHTSGHEFVYPEQEEQQLALSRQRTIVVNETAEAGD